MELWLVRHGESMNNAGAELTDPPLSDLGRRQAAALGAALAATRFEAIFCSHLTRAVQTAAAVASRQAPPPPLRVDPALAECGTPAEPAPSPALLSETYPSLSFVSLQTPSFPDDAARAADCLRRLVYPRAFDAGFDHMKLDRTYTVEWREADLLIVAHGTFNAYLIAGLMGFPLDRERLILSQENACVSRFSLFRVNGKDRVRVRCLNDRSYLRQPPPPE